MEYLAEYIDKRGDQQDFVVTSTDVRAAIKDVLEQCPDCRRVISCKPRPPFKA
jgi:hypothetical protein